MINKKNIYAIIPARGGSKGIPKKNIKKFNGKPLIAHSILYAECSNIIDQIIVSTNNNDIKSIAIDYGADVIERPDNISKDNSKTEDAIQHVISSKSIKSNSIIVLLQPTSPLRPQNSLDLIIKKFENNHYDSLLSLSRIHPLTWKINSKKPKCMYDYTNRPMRQQFKDDDYIYDENGSIYIFTVESFLKYNNRLGGNIGFTIFPEEFGKQIDTPLDFIILESIAKELK